MKKTLLILLTILLILSTTAQAFADTEVDGILDDILSAKMEELGASNIQELIDKYAEKPVGNEWWILAIRNSYEDLDYSLYRQALEQYVLETQSTNLVTRERIALTLLAVNSSSTYPAEIIDEATENQSINATIFALHLLNNGVESSKYNASDLKDRLLSLQCDDGGWALTGASGDPDITTMTMQALAPFKDEAACREALEKAIDFLSNAQLEDGGFRSYGNNNPESPAQVMLAMAMLGQDVQNDERFFKNGYSILDNIETFKVDTGLYSHTEGGDANQTSQTQLFYCLTGYKMMLEDKGSFYVFGPLSEKLIEREAANTKQGKNINIKLVLYIAIGAFVLLSCIIKLIKKETKAKAYLSVILIGSLLAGGVSLIKIESTGDYYQKEEVEHPIFTTISIYCKTVEGQKDFIPEDGIILEFKPIQVEDQASIYDQLIAACKEYKIQLESEAGYVKGISNIYEYSFGDLSGWMFKINGKFCDVGCSQKTLSDGDYVEWVYTVDLGKDVGNEYGK